ncbi:HalOD1 output domain-containing protein [Halegenticoccus tardaugens]|uniref:HalOD1 output domain-containing protein n=1 Tax=Halegenticoccus tardaugens TaxID=2071624 RepID=UPI00100A7978|nr:HalOD1 output domain-containing protein [Halegenticoccus tardaugens]
MNDETRTKRLPENEELSTAVVKAVAEAVGVDPLHLDARLYDSIDPDGLDQVFRPRGDGTVRTGAQLEFEVAGCEVVVHSEGRIVVTPPARRSSPSSD